MTTANLVAPRPVVATIEGLSRTFPGPPSVQALQACTLDIHRGEYIAVTGSSGSGKTTLLSLLGLLDVPTAGRYVLDGVDTASLSDRERSAVRAHELGFVFQAFHLLNHRSVLENVEMGLLYQGVPGKRRRERAIAIVQDVGLSARCEAPCAVLSGGEKQRVAIARALIREPALVLCDEPTGNLDSASTDQVLSLVGELHQRGLTIVMITHDPAVARRASRHLIISDGVVSEAPLLVG
jgi:putative ABC transport system ATP-binding protein